MGTSAFALSISGTTTVCPGQTYTYSVAGINDINETRYYLEENGVYMAQGGLSSINNTFTVTYSGVVTSAVLRVISYLPNSNFGVIVEQTATTITKRIPVPNKPAGPDGYLILGCSSNEQITINSLPALGNNPDDCYFHCAVEWSAPSGWLVDNNSGGIGNPVYGTFGNMKVIAPGSSANGNVGQLTVTAYYSTCSQQQNTSNSSTVWYGTPNVRDATVNGQPAQSFNVVGGSAYLTIQSDAASSYTWSIVGGNGYIYPSNNSCNVSVNGFVRVEARANNRCGNGSSYTFYLSTNSMGGYAVYPNPAKDQVNVDFESNDLASTNVTGVELLNEKGKTVKTLDVGKTKTANSSKDSKSIKLNVNDLPRGTYFLHVSYGDQVYKSQVILD